MISASAAGWSGTLQRTRLTTAASTEPSSSGKASASPSRTVTGTADAALTAAARSVGSGSIATTSVTVLG